MKLIECKKLTIGYDNKVVLSDINFSIDNGSFVYIVGENGVGKSTLIKCLLKLKKPINGTVEYCPELKQNEIGYLPQQSDIQRDFPAGVNEIVLSGCLNKSGLKPFYTAKQKKKAKHNMELMNIEHLKNKSYQELSGGQQQRVLLARSLCASSKALLLDEPTTGLDPIVSAEFNRIIDKLNKEYRITVIMVSHNIENALKNATHILHLKKNGYFYGTTEDYLNSEEYRSFMS